MGAVAKRWVARMLALAEGDGFLFGQFELHRGKFRGFMGAITERLIGGQTAFTPPIFLKRWFLEHWSNIADFLA